MQFLKEEDRQRLITNSVKQIIITTDLQGKITFANQFAQKELICSNLVEQNEFSIGSIIKEFDFTEKNKVDLLFNIQNSPQKCVLIDSKCFNSKGEQIWIHWTVQLLSNECQDSQELLYTGYNNSKEKQLEHALQSTQEIQDDYQQLFNRIDGAFSRHKLIFDASGKPINYITYEVNAKFEKDIGATREQVLGKYMLDHVEKSTLEPFDWLGIFSQVALTGQSISFEQYMANLEKYFRIHVYSVKPGYFDILSFDITDHHIIEQYMNRMQKMDALNHMAKGIAHEFNNLLTVIMGNLSVLKYSMGSKHDDFELVDDAERASIRARDITAEMLTYTKDEEPIKQKRNIKDSILEAIQFNFEDCNAQFELNISPGIWSVDIDPMQIRRAISNILLNAKEASVEDTPIQIQVENIHINKKEKIALSEGNYVRIQIIDHGTGISKENLPRVFDPFYTTKAVGRGLGLATALSIVSHHGGNIECESQLGKGSTFRIYLPASFESEILLQPTMPDINGKSQHNVLIMDDEPLILKSLEALLKILGYCVETAHTGEQAIEKFKNSMFSKPFDLVILDLTVSGGMGGKETIKTILDLKPDAKVLLSSGFSHDTTLINYGTYGFYGILPKPYDMSILKETLKKCGLWVQEK